jgi:DNA-binding CsgD family transcriptional regulator/tetratricopeptide (TPR) repeat protein
VTHTQGTDGREVDVGADAEPVPFYRRTFVGRASELRQLQAAFNAAADGNGALISVLGEPGIGKTTICEQLAAYATEQGGLTMFGHCYESGSLSRPYLPFAQALRQYVLSVDPERLAAELGAGAADVARIVPEVRQRLDVPKYQAGDPDSDRWRLLQALADFVRSVSYSQPLLMVLEDLHDADSASLDVLVHMSRTLQDSRLLLLATYRDVDVDRAHPLSAALAELRRASSFVRMPMHGLGLRDVQHMLASLSGQESSDYLAELVHRQTEGNPLFVQELFHYLVEQGLWDSRDVDRFQRVGQDSLAVRIPEGLRDVIGKRLSRLSERTNQVLAVASVLGIEFQLEALLQVAQQPEENVIEALEEAARAALLDERAASIGRVTYRFRHAFVRQTLYEEMSAPRRMRWHREVARALEQLYQRHLDEHAAELARHFLYNSSSDQLTRGVAYAEMAATRAMGVYAYGEAARFLQQALEAQELLDPDDWVKRCDLLLALADALLPTYDAHRVHESVAAEAFTLAEAHTDSQRAARAAIQALEACTRTWSASSGSDWVARADRHAALGTVERVYADLYQGRWCRISGRPPAEGHAHFRRALESARQLGDEAAFAAAAGEGLTYLQALPDLELIEGIAHELTARSLSRAPTGLQASGLLAAGRVLLSGGDRDGAERAWQQLAKLADDRHDPIATTWAMAARTLVAILDGQLVGAMRHIHAAENAAQSMHAGSAGVPPLRAFEFANGLVSGNTLRVRMYLGQVSEELLPELGRAGPSLAARTLTLAALGRCAEAAATRLRLGDVIGEWRERGLHILVMILEASVLCGDRDTAEALVSRLAPLASRVHANLPVVSYGRLLGEAAAMLGQADRARDFYRQATRTCERIRFRPELALIQLDLAELLYSHFPEEQSEIREHLGIATEELRAMDMQPGLERALQLGERVWTRESVAPAAAVARSDDGLTAREREVASLVAAGQSNREIAEALVISEGTAEVHVKHILGKLGFKSRAQVAAWVAERGQR